MKFLLSFVIACAILLGVFSFFSSKGLSPDKSGSGVATVDHTQDQPLTPRVSASVNQVTLAPDVTAEVSGLTIHFNTVTSDNRCPTDVQCIVAGAVRVNITLEHEGESKTLELSSDESAQDIMGYKVKITSVSPETNSKLGIKPNEYRVTFKVE